jgi:hypothetical protein
VLGRVLRDLRRDGRIDDLAELLATLAATSAKLVDVVCASDGSAKEYVQAAVVKAHTKVLVELAGRVGPPVADKDDPWENRRCVVPGLSRPAGERRGRGSGLGPGRGRGGEGFAVLAVG